MKFQVLRGWEMKFQEKSSRLGRIPNIPVDRGNQRRAEGSKYRIYGRSSEKV